MRIKMGSFRNFSLRVRAIKRACCPGVLIVCSVVLARENPLRQLPNFFLMPLPRPHPSAAAVLVDECDAGCLERAL
jgi:hypothetical protein